MYIEASMGKTRTCGGPPLQSAVLMLMLILSVNAQTGVYEYYMDSHTQCGKAFILGTNSARVVGHGQVQSSSSPTSCAITLSTEGLKEQRVFKVEVAAAQITDTDVTFYIYDGQSTSGGARPLDQFSYNKAPGPNYKPLITSGGFVTFYLKKQQSANYGFNIDIFVTSITGSVPNPDQCENGQGYGCTAFYNYNPLLTKEQITGIIGGLFGVVLFVIVPIVIIWCYCRQKGVTRRWDEYSLKGVGNTAASINGSSAAKEPWSSQTSRQPFASIRKSPQLPRSKISRPSDSEDSLFLEDSPPRNPPPPPPYSEVDRYDRYDHRSRNRRYHDERSDRYEREERKRIPANRRQRDRYGDAAENSYVQTDDDHPQEDFVEKIITPRVKPRSAGRVKKGSDEDEDPYDSIKETKERRNKKKSKSDSEDEKTESDAEDSDERNTESENETSEEESESEEEKVDDRKALYAQSSKAKKKESKPDKGKQQNSAVSQPMPVQQLPPGQPLPSGHPPQGVPPGMMMRPPYQAGYPPRGIPVHPAVPIRPVAPGGQQPPFHHPSVVRPVLGPPMTNQPFQPIRYQQPPARLTGLPQQGQGHFRPPQHPTTTHNAPKPKQPDFNTQNTPTFSHLVQRGYETGRRSPDSLHTDNSYRSRRSDVMRLEDSDGGHDLGSGVELMKRTTDV